MSRKDYFTNIVSITRKSSQTLPLNNSPIQRQNDTGTRKQEPHIYQQPSNCHPKSANYSTKKPKQTNKQTEAAARSIILKESNSINT
jgi:hypothetical protein